MTNQSKSETIAKNLRCAHLSLHAQTDCLVCCKAFENDNFDVLESMGGMGGGMGDMFGVVATTGRKAKSGRRAK